MDQAGDAVKRRRPARRAVQGLGAAMLFANSPAILTKSFPGAERGRALGTQGMMTYLGLTVGPALGGWLVGVFGWPVIFFINLPVGALAIWLSVRYVPADRPEPRPEPFDTPGAGVFTAGLVALLIALDQGHAWGWDAPPTLALLAASAILLAIFVWRERQTPHPMLDLTLFRSRVFTAATASALLNYVAVYAVLFVMPFYLIRGRGLTPAESGAVLTAQPVVMAVVAPLSGTFSDRIGTRGLSTLGMAILTAGLLLLARVAPGTTRVEVLLGLAVVGLGVGLFVSPNNSALMGAAPRHRQGIAAGVLATARNLGMVLGIGLAGAVFTSVLARGGGSVGALFAAVHASLVAAAVVAALGTMIALVRREAKGSA